jgi:hypothetical protein
VSPPARLAAAPARLAAHPMAEDTLGLPKRVRYEEQADEAEEAVADQVGADQVGADQVGADQVGADRLATPSTPEEIGALVASLQQGWLGGRNQAAQQDDS